ncbi:MAG: hypothetical protein M0Z46_06950 [Actinomycetota bacterium]|jgi:hypothetical protein|nr:hypothetical protein [Actinomycetota bacterium]MDA8358946.1 hypothetical protein [Actinomycetota bacterium]
MTQPSFVPISEADQVRPALRLEEPRPWVQSRPAELRFPVHPGGRGRGAPGPDQGYAVRLARRFADRLRLQPGEDAEDVIVGVALLASRRASLQGRAPTVHDVEAALAVWGLRDDGLPQELLDARRLAFSSAAHDYHVQRALVDQVQEDVLRLPPQEIAARIPRSPAPVNG